MPATAPTQLPCLSLPKESSTYKNVCIKHETCAWGVLVYGSYFVSSWSPNGNLLKMDSRMIEDPLRHEPRYKVNAIISSLQF